MSMQDNKSDHYARAQLPKSIAMLNESNNFNVIKIATYSFAFIAY